MSASVSRPSAPAGRALAKSILRGLLGEYEYWKVFRIELPQPPMDLPEGVRIAPIDGAALCAEGDSGFRSRATYDGEEAQGFGLYVDERLVAVQWYWWGERYRIERQGRSWPLPPGSAKSIGLFTLPGHRGKGYAQLLKRYTAHEMSERGFHALYSRIWHNHAGSIQVSERTGWRRVGSYVEIRPAGRLISFRLPF